jgi:hypothetical protein
MYFEKISTLRFHFSSSITLSIGLLIILTIFMVYKDGVSNVHTRDFIREIYEALMANHQENVDFNIHEGLIKIF